MATDEQRIEFGWAFDDGEIWDRFDSSEEIEAYISEQQAASLDDDPQLSYAGHIVRRSRTLLVSGWERVDAGGES